MGKIVSLIGVLFIWQSLAYAEVKIRVLDADGSPVSNAVVSLPRSKESKTESQSGNTDENRIAVMDQVAKQFLPHVLIVESGQPVVFPNSDQVRHHVYSFSKPNDFEIRLYSGNQTEPLIFDYPGVVILGCNIHDQMLGFIYVHNNEIARVSDQNGYVVFDEVPSTAVQTQNVTVWHSQLSSNKTERLSQVLNEKSKDEIWILKLDLIPEIKKVSRKFKPRY